MVQRRPTVLIDTPKCIAVRYIVSLNDTLADQKLSVKKVYHEL